jgi:DNA-nicking Smr family endonuclease|tara:strand:+ start:201 stop:617 length:417 start_codon:yes stop_codon:yes gene_type:complete
VKKKEDISQTDKKDWDEYTSRITDIVDKEELSTENNSARRFKFDLHGYTLSEANIKAEEIISHCLKKNVYEILLITGKGIHSNTDNDVYSSKNYSKLRYSIPEYLNTNTNVANKISYISKADLKDGGDGAIIIKLKKL